jgi:hypothetical protein
MNDILYDDLYTLYLGGVCLYRGEPVKVLNIQNRDKPTFTVLNLEHQQRIDVVFNMKDFSAPLGRIGFINHSNDAWYITRKPSRQWAIGIKSSNVAIKRVTSDYTRIGAAGERARKEVVGMELKALSLTIKGTYPKFEEALAKAVEHKGVYAFDKQFAIDAAKNIFYKTSLVGKLKRGKNLQHVVFHPGFEYLELPLMQHYEKTFRTFGA